MNVAWRSSTGMVVAVWLLATGVALFNTLDLMRTRPAPDPRELHEAVLAQWKALREGDYSSAYRRSSLDVRERYSVTEFEQQTREQFRLVPQGYRLEIGPADIGADHALLRVLFVSEHGAMVRCAYRLDREVDGWRVASIRFEPPASVARRAPGMRS